MRKHRPRRESCLMRLVVDLESVLMILSEATGYYVS